MNKIESLNLEKARTVQESQVKPDIKWELVLDKVTQALESPEKLSETKDFGRLLEYQKQLSFYHLKVEFLAKAGDSLSSVVRRIQQ
jgi:hypothetical protein